MKQAGLNSWRALLAALVLLLQGLIPAAAIAHDHAAQVQICTAHGLKVVTAPGDAHRHFGGLACEQCVMASFAAVPAAEPPAPILSDWVYAEPRLNVPAAAPLQARAPPRPPSRAPPADS